ncbi:MAG: ribonuclease E/G, partial [Actinobacteria bacterium]|nr:ribonuclease E/G [Actinomycetota bacterium]
VIDFIDMVLESNRQLVLRRLIECLGRDRTKHQVAEVTSLGLVQMTRKRLSQGLLEVFSEPCQHCNGRGVIISTSPSPVKEDKHEPSRERGGKAESNGSTGRGKGGAKNKSSKSSGSGKSSTAASTAEPVATS